VTIHEDRFGTIWIGTSRNGLNRYNRVDDRFARYRSNFDDPTALQSDIIQCLHEDSAGELWIGTWAGGLHKYNRADDTFTYYLEKFPTFHPEVFEKIKSLKEHPIH
jgi:ligand-binding sensor domain-containing protein